MLFYCYLIPLQTEWWRIVLGLSFCVSVCFSANFLQSCLQPFISVTLDLYNVHCSCIFTGSNTFKWPQHWPCDLDPDNAVTPYETLRGMIFHKRQSFPVFLELLFWNAYKCYIFRVINASYIDNLGISIIPGFSDPVKGRLCHLFVYFLCYFPLAVSTSLLWESCWFHKLQNFRYSSKKG